MFIIDKSAGVILNITLNVEVNGSYIDVLPFVCKHLFTASEFTRLLSHKDPVYSCHGGVPSSLSGIVADYFSCDTNSDVFELVLQVVADISSQAQSLQQNQTNHPVGMPISNYI